MRARRGGVGCLLSSLAWPATGPTRELSPCCLEGLASLKLDYDATHNPAIFDQLLQQTPEGLIARGQPILAEQARQVAAAVATAFPVQLGGPEGASRGWGSCLAVQVGEDLAGLRSQLGNALAEASQARGLRPLAVVAYIEVRLACAARHAKHAWRFTCQVALACGQCHPALCLPPHPQPRLVRRRRP